MWHFCCWLAEVPIGCKNAVLPDLLVNSFLTSCLFFEKYAWKHYLDDFFSSKLWLTICIGLTERWRRRCLNCLRSANSTWEALMVPNVTMFLRVIVQPLMTWQTIIFSCTRLAWLIDRSAKVLLEEKSQKLSSVWGWYITTATLLLEYQCIF